ncbi:MAG: hypothetical protein V4563_17195 [Pseudomonadota bacterium]
MAGTIALQVKYADGFNRKTAFVSSDGLDTNQVSIITPSVSVAQPVLTPTGYTQTLINASTALVIPPDATMAVISVEVQAARWRDDGVAPSAAIGMPLAVGSEFVVTGAAELAALRFIGQVAGCLLNASFYR